MVNILGQHVMPVTNSLSKYPNWSIHLYGKQQAKKNRKMGHVTIMTDDLDHTIREINDSAIWAE